MTYTLRCLAVAIALPLGALTAQEAPTVASGTRVRVTNNEHLHYVRVVGTLESIDSASIIVRTDDGDTITVPRQVSTRLDVSAGPGVCSADHRGNCTAVGFFGGAALGAVAGAILVHAQFPRGCSDDPCGLFYLLTVPAGALVGTIVGAVVGGEHWESASLPARLSLGPDSSGRFALGLSVTF